MTLIGINNWPNGLILYSNERRGSTIYEFNNKSWNRFVFDVIVYQQKIYKFFILATLPQFGHHVKIKINVEIKLCFT